MEMDMKKLLSITAGMIFSLSSHAQSEVKLYGIADSFLSLSRVGGKSITRLGDGGHAASRFGISGMEDLGGGNRVRFMMDGGLGMDTGNGTIPGPGFAFTRQSFIGLEGGWGGVFMGRQYSPMFYSLLAVDPFGLNLVFSPTFNALSLTEAQQGSMGFSSRTSNMLRYRSPSDSALTFDIGYAPGEAAQASKRSGSFAGLEVKWKMGPAQVVYAYQQNYAGSADAPQANPAKQEHHLLGGSYKMGPALLGAYFARRSNSTQMSPSADIFGASLKYEVSANGAVLASVVKRNVDNSSQDQVIWSAGYEYSLSKRTTVYARAIQLKNRGGAASRLSDVTVRPSAGEGSSIYGVGIRHIF